MILMLDLTALGNFCHSVYNFSTRLVGICIFTFVSSMNKCFKVQPQLKLTRQISCSRQSVIDWGRNYHSIVSPVQPCPVIQLSQCLKSCMVKINNHIRVINGKRSLAESHCSYFTGNSIKACW